MENNIMREVESILLREELKDMESAMKYCDRQMEDILLTTADLNIKSADAIRQWVHLKEVLVKFYEQGGFKEGE